MTLQQAKQIALDAAKRHRVVVIGFGPTERPVGEQDHELRMQHRELDWYGVMLFNLSKPLEHFKEEVDGLAESTAHGPHS